MSTPYLDKSSFKLHKAAAAFTGSGSHLLDHLAPLSCALDIPLILTDPSMVELAQTFYPFTKITFIPETSFSLEHIAKEYDLLLVSCKHWAKELSLFLHKLFKKSPRFVYCPHGNSDKGHLDPYFDLLQDQDMSFVYGPQMLDMLQRRKVLHTLRGTIRTGNYRKQIYELHKNFYDNLANELIFSKFEKKQTTLLYAPTWNDMEASTSFFDVAQDIFEKLPEDINLIVKLHPKLESLHPEKVYSIIGRYEDKKNMVILSECPIVYPILNRTDAYVGDFSSVGYDYLHFQKPLFFLNPQKRNAKEDLGLFLYRCGIEIPTSSYKEIFHFIKHHLNTCQHDYAKARKDVYTYAFDTDRDFTHITQDLLQIIKTTSYM